MQDAHDTEILYDHGIDAPFIIRTYIRDQIRQLAFLQQRIDCHVNGNAMQMRMIDRRKQLVFFGVVRVGSRAEPGAADIDRVRPGIDHGMQRLRRSGRRKQFRYMYFMIPYTHP